MFLKRRQAGAAVIVAMLVVALATIAASQFMFRSHIQLRKLENLSDLDQARWVLRGAEQWAAAVLLNDARQNSVDHLGEAWARDLPPVEAEGYRIRGRIQDQDGRFNINNLVRGGQIDPVQLTIFRRLLVNLRLPTAVADAIADWLDSDDVMARQGMAESEYYLRLNVPVRPVNRPIVNLNELLPVRGMNENLLAELRPYISVLPTTTPININTAAPEVIAALSDNMGLDAAYALVAQRDHAFFRNLGDLRNVLGEGVAIDEGQVVFSSQFFLVTARADHGRVALATQALFERKGNQYPKLIWRAAR